MKILIDRNKKKRTDPKEQLGLEKEAEAKGKKNMGGSKNPKTIQKAEVTV